MFGTGGSPSAEVDTSGGAVTLSTTWTRYTTTITLPTLTGKTLGTNGDHYLALNFWLSAGSTYNARASSIGVQSATIQFWGVQVEMGSDATLLERVDNWMEWTRCQRFFQTGQGVFNGYGTAGLGVAASFTLLARMRAGPTMAISTNSCANVGTPTVSYVQSMAAYVTGTVAATGGYTFNVVWTASADL